MAYKQSPFPIHKGTKGHTSALKQRVEDLITKEKKVDSGEGASVYTKNPTLKSAESPKKDPKTGQTVNWIPTETEIEESKVKTGDKTSEIPVTIAKPKKTSSKKDKGTGTVSYTQAYKTAGGKEKLGDYASWLKKAQDWNTAKYGTTEPTAYAKKSGMSKEGLAIHHADKMKQEKLNKEHVPDKKVVTKEIETKEVKPKYTSRKERKQEKTARKTSGRLSRKEIKYEKLASKAESALAEGKDKKAKRLAKRASKKLRKKGVRTSDKGVGKTSDRMIDLGLG